MKIVMYNVIGVLVCCLYLPNGNRRPRTKFDFKRRNFERLERTISPF